MCADMACVFGVYTICVFALIMIHKKERIIMFDVKRPEMTNKTFRLPLSLVKRLQEVAQNKSVSLNSLVTQCCEYALENLNNTESKDD